MSATETFDRPRVLLSRSAFSILAVLGESAVIILASVVAGALYTYLVYGYPGEIANYVGAGVLMAWAITLPSIIREEYRVEAIIEGRRQIQRQFYIWSAAFLCLPLIAFLTKSSELFSRGWMILFYFAGFAAIVLFNALVKRGLMSAMEAGRIERRKLMIVSVDKDVRMATRNMMGKNSCSEVVAVAKLETRPGPGSPNLTPAELENAVLWARSLNVEDVVVLADWSQSGIIDQVVSSFTVLPVAIHVGAASVVGDFSRAHLSRIGETCVLSLKGRPLEPGQALVKRAFDVLAATMALVLLAPLFVMIALAIKLDSRGPVLFLQRRRGYNQRVFQIWKFRTMTVLDDGDHIVQASRNDARITRVGSFLRRYNLDELPQLMNVLRGEMSLVGPRPHAVAHDRLYETAIMQYPRRLNMRPGITGWAQVNGLRGQTETDGAMARRLEYDLHYIDNWSLGLDFYILLLTVLSPRAYRNAL